MQTTPRYCQLSNHESNQTQDICVYHFCNNPIRLLCQECHRQQLHNNGPCQQQYVLTLEKFRIKYGQSLDVTQINQRRADFINLIKALDQIEQNIHECRVKATQYSYFLATTQELFQKLNQDANLLSNEELGNIINLQQKPDFLIFSNTLQNIITQTQKQVQFIDQMNQDYVQFKVQRQDDMSIILPEQSVDVSQSMNQIEDQRQIKIISQGQLSVVSDIQYNKLEKSYMDQKKKSMIKIKEVPRINKFDEVFHHQQDQIISSSAISQNGQYFAFVQEYINLNVSDFFNGILDFSKRFKNRISIIRFSEDSNYIFVGDSEGWVTQFRIKSLKEGYSKKVHEKPINNIVFLNEQQILTCSDDRSIIITDYKQEKQILKLDNYHNGEIYGLDYDKIQDIIVSSSRDKSIQFYYKEEKIFFKHEEAHIMAIVQVNFMEGGQKLLSSDCLELKRWNVNFEKKQIDLINLLQVYYEKNQIDNSKFKQKSYFTISKDNNIYVIMIKQIIILDEDFNQIQRIQTNFDDFQFIKRVSQPLSYLYIINQSDTQIQVLKKRTIQK